MLTRNQIGINLGKIKGILRGHEKLTDAQMNHHVHIVGASGYGKTVLLSHIVRDRIEGGKGILFIDLKGDQDTIEKFKGMVRTANREKDLEIFSISEVSAPATYNLLGEGSATQLRDRIMLSLNWSEEYYRNQAGSYLLKLLVCLCYLRDTQNLALDLSLVLECCKNVERLHNLGDLIPISEGRTKDIVMVECKEFLYDKDNFKSLQGLRSQLESLVFSDFGQRITHSETGINLFRSINSSKITFVFLDTRRFGDSARAVGKFILQDLKATSAKIDADLPNEKRIPYTVIIDEFADLAQEDFIAFLDRARSSKIGIVMAHQELCDLLRISPEFAGRLMGNTSTLYAFLQKRPESAEIISKMGGTKTVWKKTYRTNRILFWDVQSGEASSRETEEFLVHPNIIKSLRVGECVVIKKYPKSEAYSVDIAFKNRL